MAADVRITLASMAAILKIVPGVHIQTDGPNFLFHIPKVTSRRFTAEQLNVKEPFLIHSDKRKLRDHWFYRKDVYITSDQQLTAVDVVALLNEATNRRRLQLEKAHALQAMTEELSKGSKRAHLAQDVKILVWQRDGGRCVSCAAQSDLEFDHIIPVAMGGSNTARNLQLLCEPCNRRKGATLG